LSGTVRELSRDDLPAVAALYERVMRSGAQQPAPGLVNYFERLLFGPLRREGVEPLVYVREDGRVVGFLAAYARQLASADGRRLLLGCSGQLVSDPDARLPGVGVVLLRRFLAGPQDLSITDGATVAVAEMWRRLGGRVRALESLVWIKVLRPVSAALLAARTRWGRGAAPPGSARGKSAAPAGRESRELDAAALVELSERLRARWRFAPALDLALAEWLLHELARSAPARGPFVARQVTGATGRTVGAYLAFLPRGGRAQAICVLAERGHERRVLDDLFACARAAGAATVEGRVEPHLFEALASAGVIIRPGERALVHSEDGDLATLAVAGDVLMTRLEGEWWMAHHLDPLPG